MKDIEQEYLNYLMDKEALTIGKALYTLEKIGFKNTYIAERLGVSKSHAAKAKKSKVLGPEKVQMLIDLIGEIYETVEGVNEDLQKLRNVSSRRRRGTSRRR